MMNSILIRLIVPISLFINSWAQVTPGLYILNPTEGQIVAGTVEIKGSVPDNDFEYAEISYAFEDGQSINWFPIKRIDQPIHDDLLALWDTTTITDGVYRLRLSVHQTDDAVHEIIIENVKVGNYTHFEAAATPTTSSLIQSSTESISTPTLQQSPEPTSLPKNPASIDRRDIGFSMISGLVLVIMILGILGVYAYFRHTARK